MSDIRYSPIDGFALLPGMEDYDDGVLTPPPGQYYFWNGAQWALDSTALQKALAQAIEAGAKAIDTAVVAVYSPITPLIKEYEERERQAREYAASNFAGEAPSQVAAFAQPAGLTGEEAAQIILQQADGMRVALDALGKLRMRKAHLKVHTSIEAVNAEVHQVLLQIKAIAEQLK